MCEDSYPRLRHCTANGNSPESSEGCSEGCRCRPQVPHLDTVGRGGLDKAGLNGMVRFHEAVNGELVWT